MGSDRDHAEGRQEGRELLRALPAVERILCQGSVEVLARVRPRELVVQAARDVLEELRDALKKGGTDQVPRVDELARRTCARVEELFEGGLSLVINASGTLLHTNLGRARINEDAARFGASVAAGCVDLEIDLATGKRGNRYRSIARFVRPLTGARSGIAVNNNAAAVWLAIHTLARGKEVVVSRGELVEIGGSFRVPDIVRSAGARLVEVGTTNKTKPADYERAIGKRTALLLKTHTSNYKIVGFTRQVSTAELAQIGHRHQVPVFEDLGSGCLVDLAPLGLTSEPTVAQVVAAGADLVSFSTDKLLGGPQGGLIVGEARLVARLKANPIMRAIRISKISMALLERTLRVYLEPERVVREIPFYASLAKTLDELRAQAERMMGGLRLAHLRAGVEESRSRVGGGAAPTDLIPTAVLTLCSPHAGAEVLARLLRTGNPAVLGRIEHEKVLLDMRTIAPGDEQPLIQAIESADRALAPGAVEAVAGRP